LGADVSFQATVEIRKTALLDDPVVILEDAALGERAEISVGLGFNCYRWVVQKSVELLYAAPHMYQGTPPTRTGIPVLFPFPNRIRDGRFTWADREYRLLPNDSAGKNAIHGFVCRRPWRVLETNSDKASAWVTAEFHGSRDAADCVALWPADYRLRLTYRLSAGRLSLEAVVDNPDTRPLPFGLGFHHYFAASDTDCEMQVPAESFWELQDNLPTGKILPVEGVCDLRQGKPTAQLVLDHVLTGVAAAKTSRELNALGAVQRQAGPGVEMVASADFREVVVFTPPHRQAVCIEPYTCTTDAINLQQRGIDAGLRVLQPGESWRGVVETRVRT